jgi:hypothetical protein
MNIGIKEIDARPIDLSVRKKRYIEMEENPSIYDWNGFTKPEILAEQGFFLEFRTGYAIEVEELDDYVNGRLLVYMNKDDEIIVEDPLDSCRCSWIKTYDDFIDFLVAGIMEDTYYCEDAVEYLKTKMEVNYIYLSKIVESIQRVLFKQSAKVYRKVFQTFNIE